MRCQKHDERSYGRMLIATAQPPFTSPRIRSAGTTTSSKNTSANSRTPLIISIGATVIPGVSMSTKNAVMPRWRDSGGPGAREQHAPVGVLRQARPDLLAVDDPRRRGRRRRRREPRGSPATTRSLPVPGSEKPWHHISAPESRRGTTSAASAGGAKSMSVGASTSMSEKRPGIGEVARGQRRAELGAQHRRAAEPADALGPAVAHPARVEQDRLHPLHLRDLLVERSRRGVRRRELVGVRVEPRVRARRGSRRSSHAGARSAPSSPVGVRITHALGERAILA